MSILTGHVLPLTHLWIVAVGSFRLSLGALLSLRPSACEKSVREKSMFPAKNSKVLAQSGFPLVETGVPLLPIGLLSLGPVLPTQMI